MPELEIPVIYLQPGEWKLVREPTVLKTLLGSCVGITFRAPRIGAGAMCHAMMPHFPARHGAQLKHATTGRYVDSVINQLACEFDALGARRSEIEVKLFGGADVLASSSKSATVGKMNSNAAILVLEELGFSPSVTRLGGTRGVFIEFHTGTGEVLLRRLAQQDAAALARK
ncbi:MAG: chemotaxis protein CheD [Terracidiphilus sp.]|jgi:chemotaxis protein CheD